MPFQVVQLESHQRGGTHQAHYYHRVGSLARIWAGNPDWGAPTLNALHPDLSRVVLACDVLVVHTMMSSDVESMILLRRELGKPTVYEIPDNYLALGGYMPDGDIAHSPLLRQKMLYYAWLCDGLQVSSPGLAQLLERVNPMLAVMDNHVPTPPRLPEKPPGFVFGWGGTHLHLPDLEPIAPVVKAFCRRHPDAVFAFKGYQDVYQRCFADLPSGQSRFEPFGPYAEFQTFLQGLHVGLAPLIDTPVNRCRTDVKLAEYAAQGVAAVLADTPLYRPHSAHARLFASPDELGTVLEELYHDREQVAGLARRAYAWLRQERSLGALGAQRIEFYGSLLGPTTAHADGHFPPACADLREQFWRAFEEYRDKRYAASLAECRSLLRARPDYGQAQRLFAMNLEALDREAEALDFLDRQEVAPIFQDSFTEIQIRIAQKVCPGEVSRYVSRLKSPLRRLRWQAGATTDKLSFYRQVLRLQPFDFFALMAVIRLLTKESPGDPQLAELKERACLVAPDSVPREWLPARLAPLLTTG